MARVDADRNLLLGILAHQMDFITRDALFSAMNAWIIRKETPLGALLVERGDLATSRRDLLELLVDEHVRAHGGDPGRSLQALSSIGPVAEDLGQLTDPDVLASLVQIRSLATAPPSSDTLEDLTTKTFGQPTSQNGRFRVVRPHAHGGLGVVSVALDDELDREVAFKEIKERLADDRGVRARFVLEAEITGKLEHPGIIPIYGLGHDPTGRPFYAMRLIRGDSLAEAINRYHDPAGPYVDPAKRSLQLRELLGRFLDVCDALAYAHSRGVLHRDLKPGNVMLGPFGETLVVDWGLALPLGKLPEGQESPHSVVRPTKADRSSLPREQGEAVGTPAYMPPEQAEGDFDRLGPRSDVYGLGAILYDLLTGKRPVKGSSLAEVLHRVARGEIKPPRQVRPEVPLALEAVCLKALALRPEDRYATPRALAADVKAWLADEPVSARRESLAERSRRWAKRNRTAVTASVAALLVGMVGLGAVVAVLASSNIALDKQRLRAEDREAQAIAAVEKFRDAVANEPELKNTPALEGLRKRLLQEPLAYFRALRDRLQADRDTRPDSLARMAKASFSLGLLTNEIGSKIDAITAYQESLAIRRKLTETNPSVTQFQADLAASNNHIGSLLGQTGKTAEAFEALVWALSIRRKLAEANPSVTEFQADLANSHNTVGLLLSQTGKPVKALEAYRSALAIRRKLAEANPSVTEFQADLANSHDFIGLLLIQTGNPAEALEALGWALAIQRNLAEANPTVTRFQADLANSHTTIGGLMTQTGKPAEALEAFGSTLAIWRKLAEANPSVTEFQANLAASHGNIGLLLSQIGKPADALEAYGSTVAVWRKLAEANPSVTEFQANLAASHGNIGYLLRQAGKPAEASAAYGLTLDIWRKLAREHPESPDFARDLGGALNNLAMLDLDAKRFEEARIRLAEAMTWQRKALASDPANPIYRQFLANYLTTLIQAYRGLGDHAGLAEAQREFAELRASDPAMVALDANLSAILRGGPRPKGNPERLALAQRAYEKSLHAAAAKLWAEAIDSDPRGAEDRRTQPRYNAACAAALAGSGRGKDEPPLDDPAKAKLREQARGWLQAELAAWTRLVESGAAESRPVIVQALHHWREDPDLAGVREPKALDALPEAEREPWRSLWAGVDELLARANTSPTDPGGK